MQFSWVNAGWSLFLFCLALGVIWHKMHLLRLSIQKLVESLPTLGSKFLRADLDEMRRDLDEMRAVILVINEHVGLNGELKEE